MRKIVVFILFAFLTTQVIVAQQSRGDSLYNLGLLNQAIEAYSVEFEQEKQRADPDIDVLMDFISRRCM